MNDLLGYVECENPNADLHNFIGRLKLYSAGAAIPKTEALGPENVALRGAQLKNTEYIYGVAVYTGHDTKMSMNSKMTSNKFSTVEKSMNTYLGRKLGQGLLGINH